MRQKMRINVTGEIVSDDDLKVMEWFDIKCFSPSMLNEAIEQAEEKNESLELWMNSIGGDLWAASEMYTALKDCNCEVLAIISGLCASAATIIMMGADHVSASPTSQIMVHLPQSYAEGDYHEMHRTIEMLESATEGMLNAYEEKTQLEREELRNLLERETWLSAEEAKTLGLVDDVIKFGPKDKQLQMVASAKSFLNNKARLFEIYKAAHAVQDKPPDEEDKAWLKRAEARLAIETERFG